MAVKLEKLIVIYCVLALINVPKLAYVWDTPAFRLFDWYVNDLTYVFRVLLPFLPLAFGFTIDGKFSWKSKKFFIIHLTNRILFSIVLIANYSTVLVDYALIGNHNDDYDKIILIPKAVILVALLIVNLKLVRMEDN